MEGCDEEKRWKRKQKMKEMEGEYPVRPESDTHHIYIFS